LKSSPTKALIFAEPQACEQGIPALRPELPSRSVGADYMEPMPAPHVVLRNLAVIDRFLRTVLDGEKAESTLVMNEKDIT